MQQRGPQEPPSAPVVSDQDAERIIVGGDVELLVERARELARRSGASRTSVRRFYGEVRRIEMLWRDRSRPEQARRRAALLQPRLAYQVLRHSELREVQRAFEPLLKRVGGDRDRFQRFVEFFEAVVAYLPRQ